MAILLQKMKWVLKIIPTILPPSAILPKFTRCGALAISIPKQNRTSSDGCLRVKAKSKRLWTKRKVPLQQCTDCTCSIWIREELWCRRKQFGSSCLCCTNPSIIHQHTSCLPCRQNSIPTAYRADKTVYRHPSFFNASRYLSESHLNASTPMLPLHFWGDHSMH